MSIIASQDFNDLDGNSTYTTDSVADGEALTNAGASHDSADPLDLGFETRWFATRSNETGPVTNESSDFIGVNSYAGTNAPNVGADGTAVGADEKNFEFNDGDGQLMLIFDPVDLTGHSDVALSLDYWITSTGYESNDNFSVAITDGTTTVSLLSLGEPGLEGQPSADDGSANWNGFITALDQIIADNGMDASQIQLMVSADTNSGSENIFVDNIKFESDVVLTPDVIATALSADGDLNLLDFTQDSTDGWSLGDAFSEMQRGVTSNIPFSLADDSAGTYEPDTLGIVDAGDTNPFFGITDTVNSQNSGPMTATWTFDITGASTPYVSMDLAAMGDFESDDTLIVTASIDGGDPITVLELAIDEDGSLTYTMEGGAIVTLNDPALVDGTGVALTNDFQTFFKALGDAGNELVLTVTASTNGGSEAFAFNNIVVTDGKPAYGFDVDNTNGGGGDPGPEPEVTLLAGDAEHLTAASYNIAGVANFGTGELANNATEVAGHIVTNMLAPDIIGLQEVSNAHTVEQLDAIVDAIAAAGGPEYGYVYEEVTQAGSGGVTAIASAILYRVDRVDYVEGSADLLTEVDYGSSFPRFPLKADFTFNGEVFTIIDVHLKSGSKGTDPDTNDDAADRLVQADQLNTLLDELLDANADANILVLGDFNDIKRTEPMVELQDDEVWNIVGESAPGDDTTTRYGDVIDHIMLSDSLQASAQIDYVHVNADFGQPASDHDPVITRILVRTEAVEDFTATSFAATADEAAATAVALENAGHLADYFDASGVSIDQIVLLQNGDDDFLLQVETSDGWAAFAFDNVGSMGTDATANLIELLGSLDDAGLPVSDATVGVLGADGYSYMDLTYSDAWNGHAQVTQTTGTNGSDLLFGTNNRDSYTEVLKGANGSDFLFGGRGEDELMGGHGGDTYYYRLGDGDDLITDKGKEGDGTDTLMFGDGITAADLTLVADGSGGWLLTIDDGSSDGSTITLDNHQDDFGGIDAIQLADGTLLVDDNGFGLI
ncbi:MULTISPECIES: endonuclease/exonuclease/phosphatase family protein [Kordiimonas]|jgi:endonuclease/exonuclease/phosphatase family metal-dependent hydrolase|uniref:endonuclease/exonuclease/phosphatase family protein n=1 Tax=Kordiimonas TaxID=288021 RepID=UPI00257C8E70|nr:endonuclease/exonuclease/phosphatase family protein [Kordiimonas sp. UBA4487]